MRALDCERERLARKYDIEVAVVRAIGQPRSRSFTSGAFRTDSRAAGRSLPTRSRLRACAASSESRRTRRRTRGRSHGRGPSVRDPLTVDAPGGPHRSPVPRAGQAGASSGRRAECRQRSAATASRHRRLMPAGSSKQLQERRPDAPAQTLALACRSKRRWRAIPVHLVCVRRSRLGSVGADDHGPATGRPWGEGRGSPASVDWHGTRWSSRRCPLVAARGASGVAASDETPATRIAGGPAK
jgi:hypothetical protein